MKQIPDRSKVREVLDTDVGAAQLAMWLRRVFPDGEQRHAWLYRPNEYLGGEVPASFLVERKFGEVNGALNARSRRAESTKAS